jgi:hypothetical protein
MDGHSAPSNELGLPMNQDKAREIVAEYLSEGRQTANGITLMIVDELTQEHDFGWVFFYDSKEYIESGDFLYALAGNAPLVVLRDGSVRTTGTSRPLAEYLNEIETEQRQRTREEIAGS